MIDKKSISIEKVEKGKDRPLALDFRSLRQDGIALIQKLSGHIWTDYNLHDPGVTILEMLCIAITDLAYRTDFPIQDLLADEHGSIPSTKNSFFPKEDILTTNPVTINDIRMAIQDEIEDVYNVWLEPALSVHSAESVKGLYRVFVQMTKEAASEQEDKDAVTERIKDEVRRSFVSKRNLCEDWVRDIIILTPVNINISAEVTVTEDTVPEDILAIIYSDLENYLNPPVRYYSEEELLNAGFRTEDIFAGPLLKKGFIPEAKMSSRRRIIDPDEIVKHIMQKEGVINIKNLIIQTPGGNTGNKPYLLDELNFPYLVNTKIPSIQIIKGKNRSSIESGVFRDLFIKAQEVSKRSFISSFHESARRKALKGIYRDIEHYYSIQDHFPLIYGIGREGIHPGETNERKAQAKQLKSYLMLFEQLLANYLSQLAHGKDLFSTGLTGAGASTYYGQPLYNVPGAKEQLKAFTEISKKGTDEEWELFKSNKNNSYIRLLENAPETNRTYRERKNSVFDHLLARFNIVSDTYPVILFNLLYGDPAIENRADEVLEWKSDILNNLAELTHDRIKAIDYLAGSENIQDITGFQKKMAKLLYIRNMKRRPLSWVFDLKKGGPGGTSHVHSLARHSPRESGTKQGSHNIQLTNSYDFGDQTAGIFKHGIDINNYKIVQNVRGAKDYRIGYKNPGEDQWNNISEQYADKSSASAALQELINYLKQLNTESEGFHIVEHILLRPALRDPSFGFGFYENINTLLFRQKQWSGFKERENILSGISGIEASSGNPSAIYDKVHIPEDQSLDNILKNIRLKKKQEIRFFPRFELWAKLSDNSIIKEDYFNFRMSVIFPSWPARFRDDNFREFAEDLFRIHAPAHIRISFFWLDIFEMKDFEKTYFEWLGSLKRPGHGVADNKLSKKLINILKGEEYRVSGI